MTGRTWKGVKTGGDYGFWDVAASGARICAVGPPVTSSSDAVEDSILAVSEDGGATWTTQLLGRGFLAGAVALSGAQDVCAVGAGTVASRDGGATWAGAGFDPPGVGSRWTSSAPRRGGRRAATPGSASRRVLYDVRPGSILHTSDGVTWQEQYSHPRVYLVDVDFADADNGWAVGTRGAIRHTSDGGVSWSAQAIGKGIRLRVRWKRRERRRRGCWARCGLPGSTPRSSTPPTAARPGRGWSRRPGCGR